VTLPSTCPLYRWSKRVLLSRSLATPCSLVQATRITLSIIPIYRWTRCFKWNSRWPGTYTGSISARLLEWSAGAFELQASNGTVSTRNGIPAVSIDLVPAYALAILHFELAGVIVLFAIFCALIPKTASVGADRHTAHAKLSDFSKLKAEVVGTRSVDAQGLIDSNQSTTISVWDAEGSNVEK
jgi:hypothetical protein